LTVRPLALDSLLRKTIASYETPSEIHRFKSTMRGTSLAQIQAVAQSLGQPLLAIKRRPGSAVPVPSVVHWKVGHFAAIVDRQSDRLVMRDPTFGDDDLRLRTTTLDEEASGYFLVSISPSPRAGPRLWPTRLSEYGARESAPAWIRGIAVQARRRAMGAAETAVAVVVRAVAARAAVPVTAEGWPWRASNRCSSA
jgi:hypothetical protein